MQSKITLVLALALLASCSAPKYTYNFSHYRNDVAKNQPVQPEVSFALTAEELTTSAVNQPASLADVSAVKKQIPQLNKRERVQLKR